MKGVLFALLTVVKVTYGGSAAYDACRAGKDDLSPMCMQTSPVEGAGLMQIQTTVSTGSMLMQPLQPVDAHVDVLLVPEPHELNMPPSRRVFSVQSFSLVAVDDLKADVTTKLAFLQTVPDLFKMTDSAPVSIKGDSGSRLQLHLQTAAGLQHFYDTEKYELSVSTTGVDILACTEHGLFNGLMTLRQLVRKQPNTTTWLLPEVGIVDQPAKPWRGMMLDVSRHFFTPQEVKRFLSLMAMFKLNRFHWHLSDDQGWRFPVDKWPKLTSVGSQRLGTPVDDAMNWDHLNDNVPYGGSYTKADIRDVVMHAQSLFIEVVPELDVPGHAQSAIAAYPELGNKDIDRWSVPKVSCSFGPHKYTLAPTETGFQFVRDLVDAMAEVFPGTYVHLGGDEVEAIQWRYSKLANDFLEQHHLDTRNPSQLQHFFQEVGVEQAKLRNRRPVVWEEAMARNVSKRAILSMWIASPKSPPSDFNKRVQSMTEKGYDVVLSPLQFTYLDFADSPQDEYPSPIREPYKAYIPLEQVYAMPLPPSGGNGRVLGAQANVWTEYIRDGRQLDYRTWPRACAVAERLWVGGAATDKEDYQDFIRRLDPTLSDLKAAGVYFRPPHH